MHFDDTFKEVLTKKVEAERLLLDARKRQKRAHVTPALSKAISNAKFRIPLKTRYINLKIKLFALPMIGRLLRVVKKTLHDPWKYGSKAVRKQP